MHSEGMLLPSQSFGLMLGSPKRDFSKTLHLVFTTGHDRFTFTIHGSCSPAPALHGWSSLCKEAKPKKIYALTTDACRPKEPTLHRSAGLALRCCTSYQPISAKTSVQFHLLTTIRCCIFSSRLNFLMQLFILCCISGLVV